jgi:hypothetical protein
MNDKINAEMRQFVEDVCEEIGVVEFVGWEVII